MKSKVEVGDRVGYRVRFLRSCGMCHSDMARARGIVTEIKALSPQCKLARIDWQGHDMPERVNVANLAVCGSLAFTSEDK
jgi:hypothetical protein